MIRVLVIEDDPETLRFLDKGLRQEGYSVELASSGEDGYLMAADSEYDVIVMDIMLPGRDGLSVVKQLRGERKRTAVLVLSAKGALDDRIRGLRAGGDDYLTKPFAFAELVARVEALARRGSFHAPSATMQMGQLTLDSERHLVQLGGETLDLQPREFKLLVYLVRNRGRIVSKTMILDYVWGYGFDPQTNVVEAKVSRLRSKLAAHSDFDWIRTIRGLGYRFEGPEE
ncbi:MAG: response regulator transcription factor [Acidobacteriota bacterium]